MLSTQAPVLANKTKMQHRLFAGLSQMFGREVPLYDKSLLVNKVCNQAVVELLSILHPGFHLSDDQLDKTSGERHGAIRIGTPDEYRWVAGFFSAFDLEPHNFYDMTSLGAKSQPIIATAFRSPLNPEHRVFCSLLMVDGFRPEIRARVEKLLAGRQVFSQRAKELVLKNEENGGLEESEAEELIAEGVNRIFKWTGQARDYQLYKDLCDSGYKIAADIACFDSHHLNHLTPNTFCIDLYTSAMKYCLGEWDSKAFQARAAKALRWLTSAADKDYLKLHFRHLTFEDIDNFGDAPVSDQEIEKMAAALAERLGRPDLELSKLANAGFKDFTEGPPTGVPVLLRQDSYKALTEKVTFHEPDGSTVDSVHTARFGEIEQRFYATTKQGRKLYDRSLADAEAARGKNPGLAKQDYDAYLESYAQAFAEFPQDLGGLLRKELAFGRYSATSDGIQAAGSIGTTDINKLVEAGFVRYEGVRYEDFLPFSAAGIFASNLGQYGTETGVAEKPVYTAGTLEQIMGKPIVDPDVVYHAIQSESLLETYGELGLLAKLDGTVLDELEKSAANLKGVILT